MSAATLAACGGSSSSDEADTGPPAPAKPAAFAWLDPASPPADWQTKDLPSGDATLAYPAGWHLTRTDPGTVTAARTAGGEIVGYLNITPQQGAENLGNWASFRPAHNRGEGDSDLVPLASAAGLGFRNGMGSCVKDRYATESAHHYVEVACIVRGATRYDRDRRSDAALPLGAHVAGDRAGDLELRRLIRPRKLRKSISDP